VKKNMLKKKERKVNFESRVDTIDLDFKKKTATTKIA
jgi:hypothetical protein